MKLPDKRIAYFSMEIAIDPAMPTYSGGLDILAGDTLRAAAEQFEWLKLREVAVFVFCHVERSETSLANSLKLSEAWKGSEILRFAQNDRKWVFRFKR